MNVAINIFLFIFISFLSVPTIVTLIEKNSDVSIFYSLAEEEIQKELKEIKEVKAEVKLHFNFDIVLFLKTTNAKIFSENKSKHDSVSEEIFSPPPDLV